MDSTGMKLHSENYISGRAAEALVITLELHGKKDNANVNHYIIHTASVLREYRNVLNSEKITGLEMFICPHF